MKLICTIAIFSLLLCTSWSREKAYEKNRFAAKNEVCSICERRLWERYQVLTIGTGCGGPHYITFLNFRFHAYCEFNVNQARILILNICKDILEITNVNKKIKPFLINGFFTYGDLEVGIGFYTEKHVRVQSPYVAYTSLLRKGGNIKEEKIFYDKYENGKLVDLHEETVAEALQIVAKQKATSAIMQTNGK